MARARGELDDAGLLARLDAALEDQSGAHELRVIRAQARLSVQQLEPALEDARIALLQRPDDPRMRSRPGPSSLMGLGRLEEAQTALASLHPSEYSANRPAPVAPGRAARNYCAETRAALIAEFERYVETNPQETDRLDPARERLRAEQGNRRALRERGAIAGACSTREAPRPWTGATARKPRSCSRGPWNSPRATSPQSAP